MTHVLSPYLPEDLVDLVARHVHTSCMQDVVKELHACKIETWVEQDEYNVCSFDMDGTNKTEKTHLKKHGPYMWRTMDVMYSKNRILVFSEVDSNGLVIIADGHFYKRPDTIVASFQVDRFHYAMRDSDSDSETLTLSQVVSNSEYYYYLESAIESVNCGLDGFCLVLNKTWEPSKEWASTDQVVKWCRHLFKYKR